MNEFWNQSHKSNSSPLMKLKCRLNNGQFNSDRLTEWEIGDEWGRGRALFFSNSIGFLGQLRINGYGDMVSVNSIEHLYLKCDEAGFQSKQNPIERLHFNFLNMWRWHFIYYLAAIELILWLLLWFHNRINQWTPARPFQCRWIYIYPYCLCVCRIFILMTLNGYLLKSINYFAYENN